MKMRNPTPVRKAVAVGSAMMMMMFVVAGVCHAFQQQAQLGASRQAALKMTTISNTKSSLMYTRLLMSAKTEEEEVPIVTVKSTVELDPEEEAKFKEEIASLCQERNLKLQKVKNCRDLAASPKAAEIIKPGRLFRTGRLGDATAKDREVLFDEPPTGLGLRTLVDLRSPTELKDDESLMDPEVFDAFTDLVWMENGLGRDGCLRELQTGVSPIDKARKRKSKVLSPTEDDHETVAICEMGCEEPDAISVEQVLATQGRKERHFVSLMNEFKYVRGTVTKLRKRDIAKAIMKAPGAFLSKRIWNSLKEPFITEINSGGLIMLNELLLRFGAPGIKYVLDLCSEREKHPIAFYCTAGKDRTGMIAAIILRVCGVKPEDIVEDYSLSANVYAEMNDHQAMVGALSQRSLDPKTFLGAPPEVMADTLLSIEENYGSVEGYCDYIGFGPERREKLKKALTED
mmetsp:Transcript_7698/g.19044  ORF Transcript_7698/g.19044 Transcript_7698/m.19044 type:complete len:458 (+) Transcript_7698:145-1518(+)